MKKKLLAVFIAIVILLLTPTTSILADSKSPKNNVEISVPRFTDMPDDWSTQSLEAALANNLLIGHAGKIMANKPLTRAEIATVLGRAFKTTGLANIARFKDVTPSDWYYDEMQKAVGMGIMIGHAGELYPNKNIKREEAFCILARALKLEDEAITTSQYIDEAQISTWAKSSICALTKAGYLEGHGGKLRPQDLITRAEFAKIMDEIIKEYMNIPGMYTEVREGNIMVNTSDVTLANITVKGDLILADGIGEGTVILSSIHVKGRLIVRGGGLNSIILKGNTQVGDIYVAKGAGNLKIKVESGANAKTLTVAEGEKNIILEGKIKTVNMKSDKTPLILKKANIEYMNVFSNEMGLVVSEESKVNNLYLLGKNSQMFVNGEIGAVAVLNSAIDTDITVSEKGKIASVLTDANKTILTNEGYLGKISSTKNATEAELIMGSKSIINKIITENKENIKVTTLAMKKAEESLASAKTEEDKKLAAAVLIEAKKEEEKIILAVAKKVEEKTVKAPIFAEGMSVDEAPAVIVPPISENTDDEIIGNNQRASLKDANGKEVTTVQVAREGATLTYNLSVNKLVDGKEVTYSIEEVDEDNILTYEGGKGKITSTDPNVTIELTITANDINEVAKTAMLIISFSGDYGKISDKVVTINLEKGISQDELDVEDAKVRINGGIGGETLIISNEQGDNLLSWINNLASAFQTNIAIESSNDAIANDGTITPQASETVGSIRVIIGKGVAEVQIELTVTVPAII